MKITRWLPALTLVLAMPSGAEDHAFRFSRQTANISTTTLIRTTQDTVYYFHCEVTKTHEASVSSKVPECALLFTDARTGSETFEIYGDGLLQAKAHTAIRFRTRGYVSSGQTPMEYSVKIKLEAVAQAAKVTPL